MQKHLEHVYRKLQTSDRLAAVQTAIDVVSSNPAHRGRSGWLPAPRSGLPIAG